MKQRRLVKPVKKLIIASIVIITLVNFILINVTMRDRMSIINDFQISRHFNLQEYASPDTDEVKIDCRLPDIGEQLRKELECPLTVTSGYRTKAHNKRVGGAKNSYHIKGLAMDIKPIGGSLRTLFIKATKMKDVGGLGWYEDSHIHIDLRANRLYWVKLKGKPIEYFKHFVGAISYYTAKTIPKIIL